ncbi:MAG: hypothetical protein NZ903_01680 [Candidatus Micrarchaeota archaeon]|nr:hypothetical protein [Candidatus Micrarchaeota archaeon]
MQKKQKKRKMKTENKTEKNKLVIKKELIAIIVIVIVFVAIGAIFIFSNNQEITENYSSNRTIEVKDSVKKEISECLRENEVTKNIIFIYSEDCVYSQKNIEWIEKIKDKVVMVSVAETEKMIMIMNCLPTLELEGTPIYICTKNMERHVGSFNSESELKSFIEKCDRVIK